MGAKVENDAWVQVKIDYEAGDAIRAISRKHGIHEATIRSRIKKENWTQELRTQLSDLDKDIKEKTEAITQVYAPALKPYVQEKVSNTLLLRAKISSFINEAVDLNLRNLRDTANEPDKEKRINLTARMKATLPDLAGISQQPPILPDIQSDDEPEDDSIVKFYLPKSPR